MKKSKQAKTLTLTKETLRNVLGGTQPPLTDRCAIPTMQGWPTCDDTADGCTLPPA